MGGLQTGGKKGIKIKNDRSVCRRPHLPHLCLTVPIDNRSGRGGGSGCHYRARRDTAAEPCSLRGMQQAREERAGSLPLSMVDLVEGVGGHHVMPGEGARHYEVGLLGEIGERRHH